MIGDLSVDTELKQALPSTRSAARADRIGTSGRQRSTMRIVRGPAAFVGAASLIVALRLSGFLDGYLGLGFAAALIVLLPTARHFSLRVLLNGLLTLGFTPLTWWVPEHFLGVDHGTALMAVAAGLLVLWVFSPRAVVPRLRRLVPRVQPVDAIPVLAGGIAVLSLMTMLTVRSASDALTLMTSRWDYQSHFSIFYMVRSHGTVIPMIPHSSPGVTWGFSEYPQAFHALLATFADVIRPVDTNLDAELVSYLNLQAIVSVLTVILVVAGLCALPAVRRCPVIMAPVVAAATGAWVYGPGSIPVYEGFANFYLACGLATGTAITLLIFNRRLPLLAVAAVGAGLIGIANNWILLLTFVTVLFFARFWPILTRRELYGRTWWALACGAGALTVVGVLLPLVQLSPLVEQSQDILGLPGGIALPDFGLALVIIALVAALGVANSVARTVSPKRQSDQRGAALTVLGLSIPIGLCIWLAISQSVTNGVISYYFYKYLVALLLFTWPVAVIAVAPLLPDSLSALVRAERKLAATLCVFAATATQLFGFSVTGLGELGLPATARAVTEMEAQSARLRSTPDYVSRLLISVRQPQPEESIYIVAPSRIDTVLAARWHWSMLGRSSSKATMLSPVVESIMTDYNHAPEHLAQLLKEEPAMSVIVDPELYNSVHAYLETLGMENRVLKLALTGGTSTQADL
jgi:hypothetical protein